MEIPSVLAFSKTHPKALKIVKSGMIPAVGLDVQLFQPLAILPLGAPPHPLSSRLPRRAVGPERTRISCYAELTGGHVCGFR
jgi:hypothetical protein